MRLFTWSYVYCRDCLVPVAAGHVVFISDVLQRSQKLLPTSVVPRYWRRKPRSLKPPPCLNGDSGWNLLVAVMWCSTRSWQKQSTPSLCSVTAGVDTEKPCSLTGAERTPLPLESLHTWKLNLIFAGWSSWALALVQKSLGSQGVTAFITFLYMKGIVFKDNEYLFLFPLLEHRRHGVCPTRRPCGLPSVSYRKLWAVAAGWRW